MTPIPFQDADARGTEEDKSNSKLIADSIEKIIREKGPTHPDVHVKSHGCCRAQFEVISGLSEELRQGLFGKAATYDAIVRFSNGSGKEQADLLPDGRGMAIKLLNVPGQQIADLGESRPPTQDFVMINHPVFAVANAKDYVRVENVIQEAGSDGKKLLKNFLTGGSWDLTTWHWGELKNLMKISAHLPKNPLANDYYSMAPIRFGKYIVKYKVAPVSHHPSLSDVIHNLIEKDTDFMRHALIKCLAEKDATFDFKVQLRTSEQKMPIDNARKEWPENESPYQTVARLTIPKQAVEKLDDFQKQLSFSVWHAIEEHRPLGTINLIRREAYLRSSQIRHQESGTPILEPTSIHEVPENRH